MLLAKELDIPATTKPSPSGCESFVLGGSVLLDHGIARMHVALTKYQYFC